MLSQLQMLLNYRIHYHRILVSVAARNNTFVRLTTKNLSKLKYGVFSPQLIMIQNGKYNRHHTIYWLKFGILHFRFVLQNFSVLVVINEINFFLT